MQKLIISSSRVTFDNAVNEALKTLKFAKVVPGTMAISTSITQFGTSQDMISTNNDFAVVIEYTE